ncbi:MAG: transcriptional regulator [Myxococcota bacterium]|nr:transcriptional regulator [Myxococcota bacterium]
MLDNRREGLGLDEAAAELNTGRRTVYRDLEVLQAVGFPVVSEMEGRRARWKLMDGHRSRVQVSLSWAEHLSLHLAVSSLQGFEGTFVHDSAVGAVEKLRAALPGAMAERIRALSKLASAQRGGHDYSGRAETIRGLTEAIDERRTVQARYRSRPGGPGAARRLDPLHLHVSGGAMYVLAWCHRSKEVRTFLVDRFDGLEVTGDRFEPREDFDPGTYLRDSYEAWHGKPEPVRFVVAPPITRLFLERKHHPSQRVQLRGDGSAEVTMRVPIVPPLVALLGGYGAQVSEIAPAELETKVGERVRGTG